MYVLLYVLTQMHTLFVLHQDTLILLAHGARCSCCHIKHITACHCVHVTTRKAIIHNSSSILIQLSFMLQEKWVGAMLHMLLTTCVSNVKCYLLKNHNLKAVQQKSPLYKWTLSTHIVPRLACLVACATHTMKKSTSIAPPLHIE